MHIKLIVCLIVGLFVSPEILAQERQQVGKHLYLENVPKNASNIGREVSNHTKTVDKYSTKGWTDDGAMLLSKSGDLYKSWGRKHKYRKILDLADYPLKNAKKARVCGEAGFIFQDDKDGDEYYATFAARLGDKVPAKLSAGIAKTRARIVSNDRNYVAYASSLKNSGIWTLQYQEICEGSSVKQLYAGRDAIYARDFHPNDALLLATIKDKSGVRLVEFNVRDGSQKLILFSTASVSSPFYSADGRYIFYVSDEDVDFRELYRLDRDTGEVITVVGNVGLDIDFVKRSDDRTKFAVILNKFGLSQIAVIDANALKLLAPMSQKSLGVISSVYFSPDGGRLALRLSQPTVPSRSGVYDYQKDEIKLWTGGFKSGGKKIKLLPDVTTYPTFDQVDGKPRRIPMLAYKPENASAKYPAPVVIFAHGGPASQARPTWSEFYHYIVTEMGIAVLRPNIRGSTGYGREFEKLDQVFKREDAIKDIGALLDWIEAQPDLDASRIVIAGGSYGGYVSMGSLAMYPERFRGGITRVGVLDFHTFMENTEPNRVDNRRQEYGDERDPAVATFFEKISPVRNAHKITKPVLIVQGARDPRVPLQQAEDMLAVLKAQGVETSYVLAMNEGHSFSKSKNKLYRSGAQIAFLRKHLLSQD